MSKRPMRWLRVVFGFYFLGLLVTVVGLVSMHMERSDVVKEASDSFYEFVNTSSFDAREAFLSKTIAALYLSLFLMLLLGGIVAELYRRKANKGIAFVEKFKSSRKEIKEVPWLQPALHELSLKLDITPDFKVLLIPQAEIFPSVEGTKNDRSLIMGIGFISFFKKDPQLAKFVLAHELAHLKQDDLFIYRKAEAFSKVLLPLVLVIQSLSIVWKTTFPFWLGSGEIVALNAKTVMSCLPEVLTIASVLFAVKSIKYLRKRSELLADLGAAVATSPDDGIQVFEKYLRKSDEKANGYHPSPEVRTRNLENLKRLGSAEVADHSAG